MSSAPLDPGGDHATRCCSAIYFAVIYLAWSAAPTLHAIIVTMALTAHMIWSLEVRAKSEASKIKPGD